MLKRKAQHLLISGYDGIGNAEYYLATACQEIWLVPTAPVDVRGMMAEALFPYVVRSTSSKLFRSFITSLSIRPPTTCLRRKNLPLRIARKSSLYAVAVFIISM